MVGSYASAAALGIGVANRDIPGARDRGFSIAFWEVGFGPLSVGQATIRTRGNSAHPLGSISVNGELAPGYGGVAIGFRNVDRTEKKGASGCGAKR